MNCMERVVKALNHEEADRVPNYPIIAGCARRLRGIWVLSRCMLGVVKFLARFSTAGLPAVWYGYSSNRDTSRQRCFPQLRLVGP